MINRAEARCNVPVREFFPLPLSHSLPLRKEGFPRKECAGFFGGILPEENPRKLVAKNLHISEKK